MDCLGSATVADYQRAISETRMAQSLDVAFLAAAFLLDDRSWLERRTRCSTRPHLGTPEPQPTGKSGRGAGVHLKSTLLRYYAQLVYHGTSAISMP
jgi:hypothetical protein